MLSFRMVWLKTTPTSSRSGLKIENSVIPASMIAAMVSGLISWLDSNKTSPVSLLTTSATVKQPSRSFGRDLNLCDVGLRDQVVNAVRNLLASVADEFLRLGIDDVVRDLDADQVFRDIPDRAFLRKC